MSLYDQFQTNPDKETNGVPVAFAPNQDKTIPIFTLARMGKMNKEYTKALEKATRPYRRQIELKTMDPDVAESVFMDVFIQTILRGWQNVQLPVKVDGKPVYELDEATGAVKLDAKKKPMRKVEVLAFNETNARRLFTELPDLYEDLQAEAVTVSNYHDEMLEDEAKN